MVVTSFPVDPLSSINQANILDEHLLKSRIEKTRNDFCLREVELLSQQYDLKIDLAPLVKKFPVTDQYLEELDSFIKEKQAGRAKIVKEKSAVNYSDLELFCIYGVEIKYLPLFKYLQVANKVVLTEDWLFARREFLVSKAFDRFASSTFDDQRESLLPKKKFLWWDGVIEQIKWAAVDFTEFHKWKLEMAKILAEEARLYFSLKLKQKPQADPKLRFYEPDLLPDMLNKLSICNPTQPHFSKIEDNTPAGHIDYKTVAALADLPEVVPATNTMMGKGWRELEDQKLLSLMRLYRGNFDLVADELNYFFNNAVPRTKAACQERIRHLEVTVGSYRDSLLMVKEAERHFARMSLMLSARGKLVPVSRITPLSTLKAGGSSGMKRTAAPTSAPTQTSQTSLISVHPSHEAAVKRATQNITRMLTPGELALRRMQRMRQILESSRQASQVSTPVKVAIGASPKATRPGTPRINPPSSPSSKKGEIR